LATNQPRRPRLNEEITAATLLVIGPDDAKLGELTRSQALTAAAELGLDLVEVAPEAKPPVAKILDYAKERYRGDREARKNRRRDPQHEVKEVQIKPTTDDHDLATKAAAATRFLVKGNRVKVVVTLRGRLQQRPEMADQALERFYGLLGSEFVAEHRSAAGMRISVVLRPSS
jgi:translation initiation factor IF-3